MANGRAKERPDYQRLVADVEEHEAWIRLARRHKLRIVTLHGGERDMTNAADRFVARIVAAVDQIDVWVSGSSRLAVG